MPAKSVVISITLTPIPPSVKDHKFMLQAVKSEMKSQGLTAEALATFWNDIKKMNDVNDT